MIAAEHVLDMAEAALDGYVREQVDAYGISAPFSELVDEEPPLTEYERWLSERVVCDFCPEDYKPSEPLWVRVNFPGRYTGKIICASCISAIGFTGCEWFIPSANFASYVVNVFGQSTPPDDWKYAPPGFREVAEAFKHGPQVYVPVPRLRGH